MANKIQPLKELAQQSDAELLKQCVGEMTQIYLDKSVSSKPIDAAIVTAAGKILFPIVKDAAAKIGRLMPLLGEAIALLDEVELTPEQQEKLAVIAATAEAEVE